MAVRFGVGAFLTFGVGLAVGAVVMSVAQRAAASEEVRIKGRAASEAAWRTAKTRGAALQTRLACLGDPSSRRAAGDGGLRIVVDDGMAAPGVPPRASP